MSNLQLAWLISLLLAGSLTGLGIALWYEFSFAELHDEWEDYEWNDDYSTEIDPITGFPRRSDM